MARLEGFEPPTNGFGSHYSIRLSYRREPCIVPWSRPRRESRIVYNMDVMPTFLELAGAPVPEGLDAAPLTSLMGGAGLAALVGSGYIGRSDGAEMAAAYRFQRVLEHRVQLRRLRRTHLVPDDELAVRQIARSLGLSARSSSRKTFCNAVHCLVSPDLSMRRGVLPMPFDVKPLPCGIG